MKRVAEGHVLTGEQTSLDLRKLLSAATNDLIQNELRHRSSGTSTPRIIIIVKAVGKRSLRQLLSTVSQERILPDESLLTYLTEVERILSNHPLALTFDDQQQPDVLTVGHLFLLGDMLTFTAAKVNLRVRYSRHWKYAQITADTFWRQWT